MPVALLIFPLLILLFYIGTMTWYAISFQRQGAVLPDQEGQAPDFLSLVVPVRNEADHLPAFCDDLSAQDHDPEAYEVIFVDDHSTDRSASLLETCCREHQNYRLIRLREGASGKKQALASGIDAARGQWIIQSDADCRLSAGFISGHAAQAAGGADLVAGPVVVQPGKRRWDRFEALEQFSMVATGLAAAAAGRPVMCSGANLSYSKQTYLAAVEKLSTLPHPSGDDVFLLAEAKKQGRRIVFPTTPGVVVSTSATAGLLAFLQQRVRWGSKARYYRDWDMVLLTALVWLANAILLGLFIAALFIQGMVWVFLLALLLKSFSEFLLIYGVAARLGQKPLLRIFPAAALFYYFYVALTGIFAMTGTFSWKGRRHKGS